MNSSGQNDVSPEAMQARIQQARREAENLKDRIKRKKDELADTTRESIAHVVRRGVGFSRLELADANPAMRCRAELAIARPGTSPLTRPP